MGGGGSKSTLVSNRPAPSPVGPAPVRMVAEPSPVTPLDGGWGWVVLTGACLSQLFFPSVNVAFGVLFREHLQQLGAQATQFTLIPNGFGATWGFTALLMPALLELFGHRSLTVTGGLLSFLTMVLVAFSSSVASFALVYSVLGGISACFCSFAGLVILPLYFDSRKGLANGILFSFGSVGRIAMAPLVRLLLDTYGYTGACLLVAALSLHTCAAGATYHPPHWHQIPAATTRALEVKSGLPPTTDLVLTDEGLVEVRREGRKNEEEEGENVIYITPAPLPRQDDEVVLFSRASHKQQQQQQQQQQTTEASQAYVLNSLAGSMSSFYPPVQVYTAPPDSPGCCGECVFVKMFHMLDYGLLREPLFHLLAWPNAIAVLVYLNFLFLLPGYVSSLGYSHYQSACTISLYCGAEIITRLVCSGLSDYAWFPTEAAYIVSLSVCTVSMAVLCVSGSYWWVMLVLGVFGAAQGVGSILVVQLILRLLGVDRYPGVIGFLSLINSIVLITLGALTGLVKDEGGSYVAAFLWLAVVQAISAGVWVLRACVKVVRKRYSHVPQDRA